MVQYRSMPLASRQCMAAAGLVLTVLPGLIGCLGPQPARMTIHEDGSSLVAVEPLTHDITTRHPTAMEPRVLIAILRGLRLQEDEASLQRLLTGRMSPSPVFSAEQAEHLTRYLVPALMNITRKQQIRFRIETPGQADETEGTLYCTTSFLHIEIQRFQGGSPQAPLEDPYRQLPQEAQHGLRRLVFQFPPEAGPIVVEDSPTAVAVDFKGVKRWITEHESPG